MNRAEKRRQKIREQKSGHTSSDQPATPTRQALDLALQHHSAGRLPEAEQACRQILQAEPEQPVALHLLGLIAHQVGQHQDAVVLISQALAIRPDFAEAHANLGTALKGLGKLDQAADSYRKAIAIKPDFTAAHFNLANTLRDLGKPEQAVASYRTALTLEPGYAEALSNLGATLHGLGQLDAAADCYHRAIAIKPDFANAHSNLGNLLSDQNKPDDAAASYRKAIAINPHVAEIHSNLAVILGNLGQPDAALASHHQAIALDPSYAKAHSNLGKTLMDQGQPDAAAASYRRALAIDPDDAMTHSNLLLCLCSMADVSPAAGLEEAKRYGAMVARKVTARYTSWQTELQPQRLRVGLVSGDLKQHPVGIFVESLLAHLDPARIDLRAYPTTNNADAVTLRLRPHFSAWTSIAGLDDAAASALIHGDGVHILIDLAGHTALNRLPLFAWKPAPVQVSWLGYFATTGLDTMDYLLGDPHVAPAEDQAAFMESLVRLPESYLCFTPPDCAPAVNPLPALANGRVTFGCFNNISKMNDAVVALWAAVLDAVAGSRLFLKSRQLGDAAACDAVRERFAAHGIAAERLILEGASPRAELLAAYQRVDIALDPFPYPGGTTSAEALWMGVPVITRRGDRFLSRVGTSIARNAGLADWIAADDAGYIAIAARQTRDLPRLAALRAGLRAQMRAAPLTDAARFAGHFEAALWSLWQTFADGQTGAADPQTTKQQ
ncbi:MAG: tetratricopeptide repeat protein [Rhodospirillales bacterium]|nr:tetratricopeptide repeat protein [Rhodospirillales bacterium]